LIYEVGQLSSKNNAVNASMFTATTDSSLIGCQEEAEEENSLAGKHKSNLLVICMFLILLLALAK